MLRKILVLGVFVAPILALAQQARPVRPVDEPTQVDGNIIEDANDPPPLELCPTVCRSKATGEIVRRICLMDEADTTSADEKSVIDKAPNAAVAAGSHRKRHRETAVAAQARERQVSAAEKSELARARNVGPALIDVECSRYEFVIVGIARSNKCRVSSTAYCLYNPAGKTGSPCNCGTRAGYFG